MRRGKSANGDGKLPLGHPILSFFKSSGGNDDVDAATTPQETPEDTTVAATDASSSPSACPVRGDVVKTAASESACPVRGEARTQVQEYNVYSQPIDPSNQMPAVANQLPAPQQRESLPTERVKSTIPKGGTGGSNTWTYPSPQMFYNALARKNKLGDTPESDIPSIVALHNNMNESTWSKILQWEAAMGHDPQNSHLLKFQGRPSDLSPKALLKHYLFNHPLPFDRHDWLVIRDDNQTVRYVIDYYHDDTRASKEEGSGYPDLNDHEAVKSILVDVRPAVDDFGSGVWGRWVVMPMRRFWGETSFTPLPVLPTSELRSQVGESVQVWDSIIRAGKGKEDAVVVKEPSGGEEFGVTEEEARRMTKSLAKLLKECEDHRKVLQDCSDDATCAKASLGLTTCMAKIMCPLQHETLSTLLYDPPKGDNVPNNEYDAKLDTAIEHMTACVVGENARMGAARKHFPGLFEEE